MKFSYDIDFLIRVKTRVPGGTIMGVKLRSTETLLSHIQTLCQLSQMCQPNFLSHAFNPALTSIQISCCRMAPEVIACDEQPDATYDNRVSWANFAPFSLLAVT